MELHQMQVHLMDAGDGRRGSMHVSKLKDMRKPRTE